MTDLFSVADLLKEKDNIEILTHHYPDGDTLGSAYALCLALQAMGKNVRVITSGEPSKKYDFLKNGVKDQAFERKFVVSVDVAAPSLLGDNQQEYEKALFILQNEEEKGGIIHVDKNGKSAKEYAIDFCLDAIKNR